MKQVMIETTPVRPRWAAVAALVAVAFGILTIIVGGKTLFGGPVERAAAGNIVPFVLWFNFVAGFAYVIAGLGLFLWKRWAAHHGDHLRVRRLRSAYSAWRRIRDENDGCHDNSQPRMDRDRGRSLPPRWMLPTRVGRTGLIAPRLGG
jgi:hypothetical protein